jgi:hypothetical protein
MLCAQLRRHAWVATTKSEQAQGSPVGKTTTTRVGKKSYVVETTSATRKTSGYREAKKSFGPALENAKLVM